MKSVLVRPRKYTYTRNRITPSTAEWHMTKQEEFVEEVVAHWVVSQQRNDGLVATFYELTDIGVMDVILVVDRVVKLDGGVVVADE